MIVLSALTAASLAAGCGDDEDSGGDVSTGIAPATLLADVTAEQAASACEHLKAGFDRVFSEDKLIRTICTLAGAAFADTSADCNMLRDQCIEEASMQGSDTMAQIDEIEFDCEGEAMLDQCTGTVAQLETCFNDTLDGVQAAFNQISCDDAASVTQDDLEGFGDMAFQEPASCAAVGCPGGASPFGGDEEEETAP